MRLDCGRGSTGPSSTRWRMTSTTARSSRRFAPAEARDRPRRRPPPLAHVAGFAEHGRACRWWEALLNGDREGAIAVPALFGFVRLVTGPRVFDRPLPVTDALERVEEWLSRPHVRFALPGPRHLEIALSLL